MPRDYAIYDVFTDRPLGGNPLAVVFDSSGLSPEMMQAIAKEFNLSETVFVLPPENPAHAARIRIFTPGRELPFAGHPTVGAAVALAERAGKGAGIDTVSVIEENVGPLRCVVRRKEGSATFAEFDLPRVAEQLSGSFDAGRIADALCISAADIGFENHVPSVWSGGVPFLMIPVSGLSAMEEISFNPMLWERVLSEVPDRLLAAYVYCRGGQDHLASFHARMFAPDMGISEDPATGAAVAAMSGAIQHFDTLPDGYHSLMIEQGVEMGRPSRIHLHIECEAGAVIHARIGGEAVCLAEGRLYL